MLPVRNLAPARALAALLVLPLADGRSFRLSPPGEPVPSGDVLDVLVSPDEQRVVYVLRPGPAGTASGVWSVPRDGSTAPVLVSDDASPLDSPSGVTISPDSSRVLYLKGADLDGRRLYSAPIDGSAPAVDLFGPHVTAFRVTGDSSRAVVRADLFTDQRYLLWSAPLAGGAPLEESGPFVAAADVEEFELTPDGALAVYRADAVENNEHELFTAPIGPAPGHVRLNTPGATGQVSIFKLTPDGSRALYLSNFGVPAYRLYSVPTDASGAPVEVSGPLGSSEVESDFVISADGTRVAYRGNTGGNVVRLFGALVAGGGVATLTPDLPANADVSTGLRASVGHAVYRADAVVDQQEELFAVPLDGSSPPVRLNPATAPGELVFWFETVVLDAGRVAFVSGTSAHSVLRVAPLAGGAPIVLDDTPLSSKSSVSADPDGLHCFYLRNDGRTRLHRADLTGATPPVALSSGTLTFPYRLVGSGNGVVYRSDEHVRDVFEVFARSTHGAGAPVQVSAELPHDQPAGEAAAFRVAGERVVYSGNFDASTFHELYSTPIAEGHVPVLLSGTIDVDPAASALAVAAGGARVVFRGAPTGARLELFGAPVDGSAAPVALSGPLQPYGWVGAFATSADGSRALYLADQEVEGRDELYRVAVDGSSPAEKINSALVSGGDVYAFAANADASRVVYRADQDVNDRMELYSSDGASPPVRLSGGFPVAQDEPLLTGDFATVVFRADANLNGRFELYSAPTDGSLPPAALSGTIAASGTVQPSPRITPDGARVLFLSDRQVAGRTDLYVAPAGGGAPLLLNVPNGSSDVLTVRVDPTSARAAFVFENGLYSVPVDGSAPPLLLSVPASGAVLGDPSGAPPGIQFTPDGTRVVYRTGARVWVAPLDASAPPLELSAEHGLPTIVQSFRVAPDGRSVVYVASTGAMLERDAFVVPIDRGREPAILQPPLEPGRSGVASDYEFAQDGRTLLYRADLDAPQSFALFAALLERQPRRRALGPK